MNLSGNGYNVGADFQQDEQLARQFPHGSTFADSPYTSTSAYKRCALPCPNPNCPYYGWLRTDEFMIGQPGWDCEAFLDTLISRNATPIEAPDLQPKPLPHTLKTRV